MIIPSLALGFVVAGLPLLTIEFVSRRLGLAPELSRKLVHVGSCVAVCLLPWFLTPIQIVFIAMCFVALMLALRRRRYWHSLYRIDRRSWGEISFPVSVAVTILLAPWVGVFTVAMLVMGLADTAAALVGTRFGGPRLPWSRHKTYAGSLACLAAALAICITAHMLGLLTLPRALAAALLAALAESITPHGLDNLTIPLVVVAAMY